MPRSSMKAAPGRAVTLRLTPRGHLLLDTAEDAPFVPNTIVEAFSHGVGAGLLRLGGSEVGTPLPQVFGYWRDFAARFITAVCASPAEARTLTRPPPPEPLAPLVAAVPPMAGAEYLTTDVLRALWGELGDAFEEALNRSGQPLQDLLRTLDPAWNLVGRVHFNLAENRRDAEAPFAFLATYTSRLSAHGKVQHVPLGQALREYAGKSQQEQLLALLLPVQRAAERCGWLKKMVDAGELFHPLRWTAEEAVQLLADVPALEQAGVVLRMPASWRNGRPPRAKVTATLGTKAPSGLGAEALLDFQSSVTLDGVPLTEAEVRGLLASTSGLALIRGQWVQVDRERVEQSIRRFRDAERIAREGGLTFAEGMRLLAGANLTPDGEGVERPDVEWSVVSAGPWLSKTLEGLRAPEGLARVSPGKALRGELRPYQQTGVQWLHLLSALGLGACLADDMGLGKTIQVLSLLLLQKEHTPSLLVAPASLLANWKAELEKFAPSLKAVIAHPSEASAAEVKEGVPHADLVLTTYGSLLRMPWLEETAWQLVILDEAQAIKNPNAQQTRAAKRLKARARIALTGTPIENRLSDLWSLFDFLNPGLLGSAKAFSRYAKRLESATGNGYGPLRELVRPYLLRRLKTDARVISDLPEKSEVKAFCAFSKKQAALYEETVASLRGQLQGVEGIQRRGVVLASLTRLKQICNHPSQWLGDGAWAEADSGKWARLREIAEVVAQKQEKVLIFTQFKEVIAPLAAFLGAIFGRPGLALHGETAVGKRGALVKQFQDDESVPFMVLSLKAGGSGLNLTAASHVVHFDRWWNPAVENQATDRAFRIGQKRNVLVHKFVCRGTIEEKIDALIESKKQLSTQLLEGDSEFNLTELSNEALLELVKLDLNAVMKE